MPVETRLVGFAQSGSTIEESAQGSSALDASRAEAPTANYAAGDVIAGKYHLIRLLGQGGMGVVWEAHSDALDIRVAIKLIHRETATPDEHQRLIFEAKAAARLVDPGVVRVFDCGETSGGDPYIVMEYLEGQDLATRLDARGRIPPIEAVRTLLPIVRALGTAHAANIVHRDVKPENVFLTHSATAEEQPKLLDFGIAKMEIPWEKRLTQAGSALGSPNYMSPEQARGEEVDQRADLWAMCVVLYEAITDRLPFDGNGYNAVMYSILTATPIPFPELGINEPELWGIVARGLVRDRELRWQSSAELAQALSKWLIARGVMHDVSGVSLHATYGNHRASYVRTLESQRPAAVPTGDYAVASRSSSALIDRTGKSAVNASWWQSRPRWFVPGLVVLSLAAVAALVAVGAWNSSSTSTTLVPASAAILAPGTPGSLAAASPTSEPPAAGSHVIEPALSASVPTQSISSPAPRSSSPSSAPRSTGAPRLDANPSQKPLPTKKTATPQKPDSFKSPFD
ncbi:MAG TPA: serine/threonine-protein kinase [Polyangiaceae bacterium]|nr:serine/threonine-protein kinase [Polyangiaceae bacterium]